MAIHNWIRCHWRNGRHVVHDVPEAWHDEIETHLKRHRARERDLGTVRTATLDSVELAWVECEVPLGSPERDLTYRRARAVHALARTRSDGGSWSRSEAEALLDARYGESAEKGLVAQHKVLTRLAYPDDQRDAEGLFVGREAGLPSEIDARSAWTRHSGDNGYAQRHLVDEWERWVAEGQRSPMNWSKPQPFGARIASVQDAVDPMAETVPSFRPIPTAAGDDVEARAEAAVGHDVESSAEAAVGHDIGASAEAAVVEDGAAADEAACADASEGPLFDLSRPPREPSDAPSSSLSALLRPSYTSADPGQPPKN